MKTDADKNLRKTAPLGALIASVFDEAARYSNDPREVDWMATQVVRRILRRSQWEVVSGEIMVADHCEEMSA